MNEPSPLNNLNPPRRFHHLLYGDHANAKHRSVFVFNSQEQKPADGFFEHNFWISLCVTASVGLNA